MFLADLRHAARNLAQSPLFATVAIASLAVGIGANTALFSFLHSMVLAPLPYPDSDRMVMLQESVEGNDVSGNPQRWRDWAAQTEVFAAITAWYGESLTWTGGERAESVEAWRSMGDLPGVFGLEPAAGRLFTPEEAEGKQPAVLITETFWHRRFSARGDILGQSLVLNGKSYPVVGVLNGRLASGRLDAIVPARHDGMARSARFLRQLGRLRAGLSEELAEERLTTVAQQLAREHPDDDANLAIRLESYRGILGARARGPLLALLGCVGFVLISACLNIASLLLQRARRRGGEIAVRLALGASRWRLARLLLAEGALLGVLGGALGIALAVWGIALLKNLTPPELPRLDEVRLSWPTLAFAAALSLLTAVISSLAPAWRATSQTPQRVLRSASPRAGGGRNRTGGAFVVVQIAISLALLFGASLLLRTFSQLLARPLGFEDRQLLAFELPVSWSTPDADTRQFQAAVLDTVRAVPGVTAAEITDRPPLEGGTQDGEVRIEGRSTDTFPPGARIGQRQVSLGYPSMLGVPLLEGRLLQPADLAGKGRVGLLNRAAARLYFEGRSPIGARVGLGFGTEAPDYFEVVGVIGDLPNEVAERSPQPELFTPIERGFWPIASFVVRTEQPTAVATEALREALARRFPDRVPENFRTLEGIVSSSVAQPRLTAGLLTAFAVAALLLAAAGLYALLANAVAERLFEMAVRIAVGAGRDDIQRLVYGSALPLVAGGLGVGILGCWLVQRAVASMLFGVSPFDPASLITAAGLLAVTALLAVSKPARAASRVEPVVALRGE